MTLEDQKIIYQNNPNGEKIPGRSTNVGLPWCPNAQHPFKTQLLDTTDQKLIGFVRKKELLQQ